MPRLHGYRERLHQPIWDTLIRTVGTPSPTIINGAQLFGNSAIGDLSKTNMTTAGQLSSDQTYVILALRCWLFFDGTNRRLLYLDTMSQLFWTLTLGSKPMFQAPCWYFPSGGGVWGFDATASIFNNGTPEQAAILKLARPIIVPVRQNFAARADFFNIGAVSALNLLNGTGGADDDVKNIMFMLDGLQTRDVQ
jgi:hypothetical protein